MKSKTTNYGTADVQKTISNALGAFSALGASNHSATMREEHDYYATPPEAVDALVRYVDLPSTIWEPCCGGGHVSQRLMEYGHGVTSSDLYDHGYGFTGVDFLLCDKMVEDCGAIVTNFPYKELCSMTRHALDILPEGGILASFVRTASLEGQQRYQDIYSLYPPKYVIQFVKRLNCGRGGIFDPKESSAVAYCWIVWQRGYAGDTIVKWAV